MLETEIISIARDHCIAGWGPVQIQWWRGEIAPRDLQSCSRAHETLLRRNPAGIVVACIIERTTKLPSPTVRDACIKLLKQTGPTVLATGIALMGDGFWASAARSGLTGMLLLAPPPHPTKVFATAAPLVDWLTKRSAISRDGLRGALASIDDLLRTPQLRRP